MLLLGLAPATRSLFRFQSRAGWTRFICRFRSRRRIVLTAIGMILAIVWMGQAVAGILLRDSADREKLQLWLPLSLATYVLWNLIKITFRKPVRPFEWTAAEEEWLIGAPIERSELIRFRLAAIARAAIFKAAIFTLVMIPDLPLLLCGFIGMLAGLIIIDLARMGMEVSVWGLQKRELWMVRGFVVAMLAMIATNILSGSLQDVDITAGLGSLASLSFLEQLFERVCALSQTGLGGVVVAPFRVIGELILADRLSLELVTRLIILAATIWALFATLLRLDRYVDCRRRRSEVANLPNAREFSQQQTVTAATIKPRHKPWRFGGLGPLGWRQLLGARKYRAQLAFALTIPLGLCCLPALSGATGLMLVMNVTAGLAFYSFLLLPASMPFDLRRDLDRITVLKSLPLSPMRIVLGQLSAPIVITSVFQLVTLVATMIISPFSPVYFLIAIAILWPFNLFIFGLENLLILWYPYRLNQEGVQIFLRSILAFTAKGMLFAVGAVGILVWAFVAKWLGGLLLPHSPQLAISVLFSLGAILGLLSIAGAVIRLLAKSFERFDPACDLAGLD